MSIELTTSRKQFGIFYTPDEATRILCEWAIQSESDRVLEPSFGACGFLEASRDRLAELGCDYPAAQLSGCDIDPGAFCEYLHPKFGFEEVPRRFLRKDFLQTEPEDFADAPFTAIIGNPPYVSKHNMDAAQRAAALDATRGASWELDPKASLWAYFVLHACSFLAPGGRMAWLLPSSFIFADYATSIRAALDVSFERCLIVRLDERLFLSGGTEESTAVLLAEGYGGVAYQGLRVDHAATLSELRGRIRSWMAGQGGSTVSTNRVASALLRADVRECMGEVEASQEVVALGDVADIRIGIVTGANSFFVLDENAAALHNLPEYALRPILAKLTAAPGAELTQADLIRARGAGQRTLLVDTTALEMQQRGSPLRLYLASMPRVLRRGNRTFRKRRIWHRPDDGRVPDGFFPYMYHHGPRIILNSAGVNSTNTIHRVYFRSDYIGRGADPLYQRKALSIALLSTYSQVSAELEGRSYGSGVLKHEPSEAKRIRLALSHDLDGDRISSTFASIDGLLRNARYDDARRAADDFIWQHIPPRHRERFQMILEQALRDLRQRRHRPKDRERQR